jgi:hypothetical protein
VNFQRFHSEKLANGAQFIVIRNDSSWQIVYGIGKLQPLEKGRSRSQALTPGI